MNLFNIYIIRRVLGASDETRCRPKLHKVKDSSRLVLYLPGQAIGVKISRCSVEINTNQHTINQKTKSEQKLLTSIFEHAFLAWSIKRLLEILLPLTSTQITLV